MVVYGDMGVGVAGPLFCKEGGAVGSGVSDIRGGLIGIAGRVFL